MAEVLTILIILKKNSLYIKSTLTSSAAPRIGTRCQYNAGRYYNLQVYSEGLQLEKYIILTVCLDNNDRFCTFNAIFAKNAILFSTFVSLNI